MRNGEEEERRGEKEEGRKGGKDEVRTERNEVSVAPFYIYPFNARGLRSSANVEEEKRVEIFI